MSKKINKLRSFWSSYLGTLINKGAKTQLDRLNKNYDKHRSKSTITFKQDSN